MDVTFLYLQTSGSDADLSVDGEKTGAISDDPESAPQSATEQSDGEYVNPRGVRFMPHQNVKDGMSTISVKCPCICTCVTCSLGVTHVTNKCRVLLSVLLFSNRKIICEKDYMFTK